MRNRTLALGVAALLLVAGCGSAQNASSSTAATADATTATFVLSEFKIVLDGIIPAGEVTVTVANDGDEEHELVIVAASDEAAMPMKPDGTVDEDKIADADKVGESEDIAARSSTTETFTFKPGTYVAFCNIIDEMGMAGGTAMDGNSMPMGNGTDNTVMGGNSGTSGSAGSTIGHVHFAEGMHMTFTVK